MKIGLIDVDGHNNFPNLALIIPAHGANTGGNDEKELRGEGGGESAGVS